MKVLIACEFSGTVARSFAQRNHDTWSCDLLESDYPKHYQQDVLDVIHSEKWDLMIAHPPCTHLAVAGAKHFTKKILNGLQPAAIGFVWQLWKAPIKKICIENPVSVISSFIGPATQYVQPYEFGEYRIKKTGLWLKGLPKLKPTKQIEPPPRDKFGLTKWYNKVGGNSPNRWKYRSLFSKGIAEAMADQWYA